MATEASSQTTEAISIPVLKNQSANLVLRTDPNLYPQPFVAFVECLKVSVLGHALTHAPTIPAALVHRAHYTSNALFDTNNNVKDGHPTAEQLVDMFNAMGYEPQLETISTFKKKQLPDFGEMLLKVSMDCDEVKTCRNTLLIPYPVREIIPAAPAKVPTKAKGKKKVTGGPSGPKKVEKKRKASKQATPKRKQPKRSRKLLVVDESSDSERTPSANIQAEEEEEH
ncbi:hypothetical protein L1887_14753 [Cichorium endivia]|nr:hypothetical protein L1887_14753 [Cichorium endivia]